ncbi:hypothetical protein [Amycolatopsis sp. La24]|uniref:hypothetical protein n=1 Tax=Amycolatopsis sp. La24 TaxID=3028304 RepID=UPI0023B06AA9|nr:hypothetical protein [Amycolatopsis sp. La24]
MSESDVVMVCTVCRNVLDIEWSDKGARYIHTRVDAAEDLDHAPVPIDAPPGFRGGRCDFCSDGIPAFVLPVRDFVYPDDRSQGSRGDWAACPACATLISRNKWLKVIERVAATHRRRTGSSLPPEARAQIRIRYRALRKNITGPLREIPPLR